jgi:putative DNA primase/helicase
MIASVYVVGKTNFAGGVERFARVDPSFVVTSKDWDADEMMLGTPRGTVDLRTGVLRSSDPADGITKTTAVAPSETADCPLWLHFLSEATNADGELIRFIQQWCGYCLTGDTSEHVFVFIYGSGGNGKGVWLDTVSEILGEYHRPTAMETFTASKFDRHPTELAALRGARMVSASETERGRRWAESRIKQLTGGDLVSARFMHRDFFDYRPTFKPNIIGNHQPQLHNVDDAMRRRLRMIPFLHRPPLKDTRLREKLRAEWPAILRWMIDGCLDWRINGLASPAVVTAATNDYFAGQDRFSQWLADECDVEPDNQWKTAGSAELFAAWTRYAKADGAEVGSRTDFARQLENLELAPDREGKLRKRIWRGIELKSAETGEGRW